MTIQEIAIHQGYESKSNKSFDWRNINKALNNGLTVSIAPKGKLYISPKGTQYNIKISNGKVARLFKRNLSDCILFANSIVESIGVFCTLHPFENSEMHDNKKCKKCNGSGKILQFMHYADGICFDCMGTGNK